MTAARAVNGSVTLIILRSPFFMLSYSFSSNQPMCKVVPGLRVSDQRAHCHRDQNEESTPQVGGVDAPAVLPVVDGAGGKETYQRDKHKRQTCASQREARQCRREQTDGGEHHQPLVELRLRAKPESGDYETRKRENVAQPSVRNAAAFLNPLDSLGNWPMKPLQAAAIEA